VNAKDPKKTKKQTPGGDTLSPEKRGVNQTDVKEMWFAGSHSDVGGGSVASNEKYSLSYISLRWMIQEIKRTNTRILFDEVELAKLNAPPTTREDSDRPIAQAVVGNEVVDTLDVVGPISDELSKLKPKNMMWWIFEITSTKHAFKNKEGEWETKKRRHLAKGRQLPENPIFHPSVKTRMDYPKLDYKPRAIYDEGQVKYES